MAVVEAPSSSFARSHAAHVGSGLLPPVLDQLSVLKLVTGRLDAAGIAYMVTGSIAAGHYGQPRMTRDIDVVVQLNPRDADRFVATLGEAFTGDADTIRSAIAQRSMFHVIHYEAPVSP